MTISDFTGRMLPFGDKIFRLSRRLLEDDDEARDAVQEVYLRLWSKRDALEAYRNLEAVALTTARNFCLDQLKSHAVKFRAPQSEIEINRPDKSYLNHDLKDSVKHVKNIIASLPEQQRSIIHLRDVEGYETHEIAAIMEMNENTVRVNLSRARQKVREIMINKYDYEPAK